MFDAAKNLLSTLRAKLSQSHEAAGQLARFETGPAAHREEFEPFLAAWLANDSALRESLSGLLAPLAPSLKIIQRIGAADHVTGIAADEMTEGRLQVEMDVQEAKDIVGAHVKRIGR
jgi:hypothetical protein